MLITKVMHYLLINGSSLFRAGDSKSKWVIIVVVWGGGVYVNQETEKR